MTRVAALLVSAVLMAQSADYRAEVEAFRAASEAEVNGPTGWASLVGLHWLSPGTYTIGAFVHVLLVIAIVLFVFGLLSGRRTVV